jgi:hypothetical protein
MRTVIRLVLLTLIISACSGNETTRYPTQETDWKSKEISTVNFENYTRGTSYLPVYSHIYHIHEQRIFDLTITVSIRNVSLTDSLFLIKADYINTVGENIRQYIDVPIYLAPLETIEIVIDEQDIEGGSGANFVFDWATINDKNPPLFEAVMISTNGQQGLSFTTRGVEVLN